MSELLNDNIGTNHRSGFVAVVGRPSVGKSTLVNAFVGQKVSIVSPKPQTTRNRITGILTLPEAQVIFVDTPGIHKPAHKLGEYMVETAHRAIPDADVVLFVVDVSVPPTEDDRRVAQLIARSTRSPVVLAMNKMDLLPPDKVQEYYDAYLALGSFADSMLLSATRNHNLDKLLEQLVSRLPLGPRYFPPDQVTDAPERFIAAELIREQVLRLLRQEIPHAIAVVVDEFDERGADMTHIAATIYVEKASQKGIVIGARGSMLKEIGSAARREIERMVSTKVFLELWVKVRPKWRRDEAGLRQVGYEV